MKPNNKSKIQTNFLSNNNDNNVPSAQKKPKKKCICEGRDYKIEPDLYFRIKEENERLKRDRKIQDERIKKL